MKKIYTVVFFLMVAAATFAAGFEGTWLTKVQTPDGTEIELTYVLKANGDAISGVMTTPNGDLPLTNLKTEGLAISFEMSFGEMVMKYKGMLKDDDTIVLKMVDSPMGDVELTLKRKK